MATTGAAAFAAAHRVIDRVHRDAAVVRADAEPAPAPRLAPLDVAMLGVADRTDRGAAVDMDAPHLARRHAQRGPQAFLGHQRHLGAGRATDLRAAADLELDRVDI